MYGYGWCCLLGNASVVGNQVEALRLRPVLQSWQILRAVPHGCLAWLQRAGTSFNEGIVFGF